jgi:hypothetical protein
MLGGATTRMQPSMTLNPGAINQVMKGVYKQTREYRNQRSGAIPVDSSTSGQADDFLNSSFKQIALASSRSMNLHEEN